MTESESARDPACSVSWKEGSGAVFASVVAGVCCGAPPLLGLLGLSGLAGFLSAMPLVYHMVLQWAALGILSLTWIWFVRKWLRMTVENRRSVRTILVFLTLIAVSLYVLRSWFVHVFLMG